MRAVPPRGLRLRLNQFVVLISTWLESGMAKRNRSVGSIATELVKKGREAMLSAVQIHNNPQIEFKAELFIVTAIIAWTYLLHAWFRRSGLEYRQFKTVGARRHFIRTRYNAYRHLSLEACLEHPDCPLDAAVKRNLMFLVGIRHEIEHQMTRRIDEHISAKFQAAALNFNAAIKRLFGSKYSLDAEQAFSIQFSGITDKTARELMAQDDLPQHIRAFIVQFENSLTTDEFDDPRFSYRVSFIRRTTGSKTAADKVIEFVPPGSDLEIEANKVFLKETERTKFRPGSIVSRMKAEGYPLFNSKRQSNPIYERDCLTAEVGG